jgi:hypothetical protein
MKYAVLILVVFLAGCATSVPVTQKFPEVPQALLEKCENLKQIEGNQVAITEMLRVVVQNYGMYYECAAKVDAWQDWYNEQKRIYNSVK